MVWAHRLRSRRPRSVTFRSCKVETRAIPFDGQEYARASAPCSLQRCVQRTQRLTLGTVPALPECTGGTPSRTLAHHPRDPVRMHCFLHLFSLGLAMCMRSQAAQPCDGVSGPANHLERPCCRALKRRVVKVGHDDQAAQITESCGVHHAPRLRQPPHEAQRQRLQFLHSAEYRHVKGCCRHAVGAWRVQ